MTITVAIRDHWSRDTSSVPDEWTPQNPARGQCAVSALVIQDILGGDLLRTTVSGESHYLNRLPDDQIVDVTLEQFGTSIYDDEPVKRDREYVLSFPDTASRYELIRSRIKWPIPDNA